MKTEPSGKVLIKRYGKYMLFVVFVQGFEGTEIIVEFEITRFNDRIAQGNAFVPHGGPGIDFRG